MVPRVQELVNKNNLAIAGEMNDALNELDVMVSLVVVYGTTIKMDAQQSSNMLNDENMFPFKENPTTIIAVG